jgi:hypothetical protein
MKADPADSGTEAIPEGASVSSDDASCRLTAEARLAFSGIARPWRFERGGSDLVRG